MIVDIHNTIREIEEHLANIDELLPGLSDDFAEDFLMQVQTAAASLEEAHEYLVEKRHEHLPGH